MPYACVLQPEKEEGEVGVWLLLLLASCRGSRIYKERHVIQVMKKNIIMLLMSTPYVCSAVPTGSGWYQIQMVFAYLVMDHSALRRGPVWSQQSCACAN